MSQDDFYSDDEFGADSPPPRPGGGRSSGPPEPQGMSTGMKVVIGAALGAGAMLFLCCGGIYIWANRFADGIKDAITEDPAKVAEVQKSIADFTPPQGINAEGAFNYSMFGYGMKMVIYSDQDIPLGEEMAAEEPGEPPMVEPGEGSTILLISMVGEGMDSADFQQEFEGSGDDNFEMESSETKTFTIGGEECDFLFAKGKITDNEKPYRQVTGSFPGREGPASIIISIPEEEWNEETVVSSIESINVD